MKKKLEELILQAIESLKAEGVLDIEIIPQITIDRTRDASHGDFASNLALLLAKPAKSNPRELAARIIAALPAHEAVTKVELAGPGFINFFINPDTQYQVVSQIHAQALEYGLSKVGAGKKVQVEFVSANPTGPLSVAHARQAAVGDALGNILKFIGFDVTKEYYVNDIGEIVDKVFVDGRIGSVHAENVLVACFKGL